MMSRRRLLAAAVLALAGTGWGQKASNWRVYRAEDGLPEPGCISVSISPHGRVLARHLNLALVSQLDGYSITTIPSPEAGKSRVYESRGGQLWTVVPQGLQEFRDGAWVLHPVPEVAAQPPAGPHLDPVPLCPVRQGLVLLLLPDRLLQVTAESPDPARTQVLRVASQTGLERFNGMTTARDGGLWISGARGLAKVPGPLRNLKPETPWREYLVPDSLPIRNLQAPHEDEEEGSTNVTVLAESLLDHQRQAAYFDGQRWSLGPSCVEKLRQAWRGPDQICWAMSIESLLQWRPAQLEVSEVEEVAARQFFDFAQEPSGCFWLATSDGLFRYAPLTWRSPLALQNLKTPVHCLAGDAEGRLWLVVGSSLAALQDGTLRQYPFPPLSGSKPPSLRAAFALRDGTLVLETREQLLRFQPRDGTFAVIHPGLSGRQLKVLGALRDGSLCVASREPESPQGGFWLERYDGHGFEPLPNPAPDLALGTNLFTSFTAQNGDLWVSGELGTACYHDNKWRLFCSTDRSTPSAPFAFAELGDGTIWCATREQVWEFDGHNWSLERLPSGRINALARTRDNSLWLGCNDGLFRYVQGSWVENGVAEGLPSAEIRELCESSRGLWAGTARGVSLYYPEADPDPPRTTIQKVGEPGEAPHEGATVTLTFLGEDKWKYTPRERLLYSYRLDAGDWAPFASINRVSFTDLPAGKHRVQVRAMDRNCRIEASPAQLDFTIILPWYRETRLVLISAAGAAGALFFAGLAFNRHRQLRLSYAEVERKVAERTQQLEVASRELLHSQKMNALGALAAGIAHDFNNILSIIKGSAQIIEDNLENPQKIRTRTDRIKTVVEQGAGIVKAMLGFSRDSGQEQGACEVNAVLEDTLRLLGDRFLREIQVTAQPTAGLPEVLASKDFIQQILLNFIFNAAESMTQDKRILLSSRLLGALPSDLVLPPAPAGSYVAVSVQDFGCGISAQNLPRIFEPFFTTKALSTHRGTGLGLSMVYELAKKMGAGLAVESAVDQGSTFTLILPVEGVATEPRVNPQPKG